MVPVNCSCSPRSPVPSQWCLLLAFHLPKFKLFSFNACIQRSGWAHACTVGYVSFGPMAQCVAHAEVTENIIFFQWVQNLGAVTGLLISFVTGHIATRANSLHTYRYGKAQAPKSTDNGYVILPSLLNSSSVPMPQRLVYRDRQVCFT